MDGHGPISKMLGSHGKDSLFGVWTMTHARKADRASNAPKERDFLGTVFKATEIHSLSDIALFDALPFVLELLARHLQPTPKHLGSLSKLDTPIKATIS